MLRNPHTFRKEYKIVGRLTVQGGMWWAISHGGGRTVKGPTVIEFKDCCGVPAKIGKPKYKINLQATRGAHNPNLQVVITHASHVCSQHSFVLPLRMNGMHRTQFDHAFWPFTPRNLIMRVLTICHLKPMQSTVLELKRFEFWPLSALRNPLGFLSTVGHVNNFL